ncbi:MAG: chromosome segregation SMC family protein [Actinomycetota bacterium]
MFLRSLQIRGFKSFADRTVLEFAPGISVIVGPNGSGKSNLVDAIAWVLGEQGPRALRGGQMADVIFAGSPGRTAVGTAEVTLVIDNEAGLIPVPDSEIEVGRVVYRSGESQYLIGGKSARLLDIQELLSDTGIGRALHTVVGQGQLEDVLVAHPEERRQFIEEAAGIAKHRRRKERAQRKLASLDQDMVRLGDVMTELKRRLRPLKQQAEAAGKYERFSREAEELAVRLAAARLRGLYASRDSRMPGWEEGREKRAEAEERLRVLDAEIASLSQQLEAGEAGLAEAEAEETEAGGSRSAAETSLRKAVEAEGEAKARHAEARALQRAQDPGAVDLDRVVAALAEVRGREEEIAKRRAGIESEIERLDARSSPHSDRVEEMTRDLERLEQQNADLERERRGLEGRGEALAARRKVLEETPGRRLLRARQGRAIGLLSELIEVDRGMEKAVAAALGPLADAVVYADHGEAAERAGETPGATLLVEGAGKRGFVIPGERTLGSVARADPRAEGALAYVLEHVYLAKDRRDALEKHRRHPAASFVTPEGVLVGPAIVRSAASPEEAELSARRDEVAVERDLAKVERALAARGEEAAEAESARAAVEEELRRADAELTAAADRLARTDAELAALAREREVLEERMAGLGGAPREGATADGRLSLQVEADRASEAREEAEAALRAAEEREVEGRKQREKAAAEVTRLRAAEAEANRSWREVAERLGQLRDEYEDQEQARRDIGRRIDEAERVLREGHDADPAAAVAALEEDETVESVQKRSDLVARRLALLGRVNLVAGDEYRELSERHEFLQREIDDVKAARRDLQQVVREVDRKVVEIFDAAFTDVAAEFESLFAQLFPGGEGKLTLTDPDDLLSTGIEIEARPGRKRVKRLSLLSGGERALTALGFLFAIFRARPSPFYLLDEVEAALDDINLHRFLELVRGFADTSQVILVTHQKRTMEAADVLYGISMGRDGASRVIAQRVADAVRS